MNSMSPNRTMENYNVQPMFTPGVKVPKMTHFTLPQSSLSDETHCGNCPWPSVMVFQGCYHKIPLTGWLKTTKMLFSSSEGKPSKSRCWQGCFLLRVTCSTPLSSLLGVWRQSLVSPWLTGASQSSLPLHLHVVFLLFLHTVFPLPRSVSEHPLFHKGISVILD